MKFSPSFILLLLAVLVAPEFALANPPAQVIVYEAKKEKWFDAIEALGTLIANETVVLTANVTDTVTHIHFDDGQRVEKGAVLAEMTDVEESALVSEMTARVGEAKKQFERLKDLPKSGAVSESLYDQREREYRAAVAQLEAMKSRLQDRLIVAPFSGVVGLRNMSVGALVEPGDEITTLTDDSVMKLDFAVPSVFLSSLQKGLPIVARTAAYPEEEFLGQVSSVDSRVDPATRSITVRAVIPNEGARLKPGLLMNVLLEYKPRESVTVPEEALIPTGAVKHVLVVEMDSKQAKKVEVKTGARRAGKVEVISGVDAGDHVITHGTMQARPGASVKVLATQKDGQKIKDILGDQA